MPQDLAAQTTGRQASDAVFEELRVLIRDVRAWFEAMPVPTEPILFDVAPMPGAVGSDLVGSGRPISDATAETAQFDAAVAALNPVASFPDGLRGALRGCR